MEAGPSRVVLEAPMHPDKQTLMDCVFEFDTVVELKARRTNDLQLRC